jgi:hypothetical protein
MVASKKSTDKNTLKDLLEQKEGKVGDERVNLSAQKANTRSKIAITFIYAFFIGMLVLTLYSFLLNKCTDKDVDLPDIISGYAAAVGSPLGFVIGYYFKEGDKE